MLTWSFGSLSPPPPSLSSSPLPSSFPLPLPLSPSSSCVCRSRTEYSSPGQHWSVYPVWWWLVPVTSDCRWSWWGTLQPGWQQCGRHRKESCWRNRRWWLRGRWPWWRRLGTRRYVVSSYISLSSVHSCLCYTCAVYVLFCASHMPST